MFPKSAVCLVFKNAGEHSYSSQIFLCIINKKFVDHLNRNNHLNDKQYGFSSLGPLLTVWLIVIMHRISEVLNNKFIMRVFTKVSQKLLTRCSYGISESVFSII